MDITLSDKLRLLMRTYVAIRRLPSLHLVLKALFVPLDAVRYLEFAYFFKSVAPEERRGKKILSLSSPHMLAYLLTPANHVTAANLDPREAAFFRTGKNMEFTTADATALDFADASFDIVYCISVIEHIHERYLDAVREMGRVLKPGGLLYITCPIAPEHREEWIDSDIYGQQARTDNRVFFQYRFSEADAQSLETALPGFAIVARDQYWERQQGSYDRLVEKLRHNNLRGNKLLKMIRAGLLNLRYGLTLFENEARVTFPADRGMGNLHLLLRKR